MLLLLHLGSECGTEMGSTFYSPLPLCFFLNRESEVESCAYLQHSYINKSSSSMVPLVNPSSRLRAADRKATAI